ncbi:MAG: hypothetical protein JWM76_4203, partial [Pseudonocardiales bacterium]|nr:hypothetical protein [Pseudonocardiales bacterium]
MSADGLDLDAIRARVDAATEGPWRRAGWCAVESEHECSNTHTCRGIAVTNGMGPAPYEQWRDQELADAEFIAHARTDVPALLAEVERL